jgi:tRNA-5-methyluridine54 2-sulfurtransferase
VINMRQHKMALCAAHFLAWIPDQTQRFIAKYQMFTPHDKILVAVSGGKDSLSVWDILLRLGYQADALTIQLGIDEGLDYSVESHRYIEKYMNDFQIKAVLHTIDVKEIYGASIPEVAQRSTRGRGKLCSVCGLVKRHEMNRLAHELGYQVLVTGHNLDDEAAVLWGNTLNWQMPYLARQAPVLPADQPGLARKVKPLFRFYEREMAAYALLRGIGYIYEECPFAAGATSLQYKELLNQLEANSPGAKMQFYVRFLQAQEKGLFNLADEEAQTLHECERCGQPTSAQGLCSFCRLCTSPDTIRMKSDSIDL